MVGGACGTEKDRVVGCVGLRDAASGSVEVYGSSYSFILEGSFVDRTDDRLGIVTKWVISDVSRREEPTGVSRKTHCKRRRGAG